MDYSIVIPVFNKAELTRQCLATLRATLEGAGEGEVIVIDNASSDRTPAMLEEFPWVRVVRNERNVGFAGATNQGAAMASGEFLVLLNNDIVGHEGWLAAMIARAKEPNVGAVGARLLFPDGTLQHAGVVVTPERFDSAGFTATHVYYRQPRDFAPALVPRDYQVVTAACMVTPRALFHGLGGLDEGFWNGYEDVDYCLKVGAAGLRVTYEPKAVLTHFESQSGPERFRLVSWNVARLAGRWNGKVRFDSAAAALRAGAVVRMLRRSRSDAAFEVVPVPKTTIVVHGDAARASNPLFANALRSHSCPIERVLFVDGERAIRAVREEMEVRGDRYLALVDAETELRPGWLDELVAQLQFAPATGAATYAPELPVSQDVAAYAADARCTLLALAKFPAHERLREFDTLHGAIADFLIRAIGVRAGVRGATSALAVVPQLPPDARFRDVHNMELGEAVCANRALIERALRQTPGRRQGLVSIVMLSWNAPQFTKLALESIRRHTRGEYEVVIVDNGSGRETVEWLESIASAPDVHVIFNRENRGFAGGNNQAMAAARGEYVVLLNNDVVVTEGWLDGLLDAFDRIPGLGVSAPRSNKIAGDQIVVDAEYDTLEKMHEYAAQRREIYREGGYVTDRAIGLCLCIDRRVIEEIGGIDERFGVGNFEDDDFCLRVRAAGYRIYVCNDVFIHHFGSQTFAANNVDWTATMRENWKRFAEKWQLPPVQQNGGYQPLHAIRRGFVRAAHYFPLPQATAEPACQEQRAYGVVFTAVVENEGDWNDIGAFARRYVRAFTAQQPVLLAIAATGEPGAQTIGSRLEKLAQREGLDGASVPDVEVSDEDDVEAWREQFAGAHIACVSSIKDRSPSSLRRYLQSLKA